MWIARLCALVRRLLAPRRTERDLHEDVQGYAEMLADELRESGRPADDARRRAQAALGGVEAVKESVRDVRTGARLELAWRDIRYAVRSLHRTPGFTATAVVTLALGMGVNTTIFSVLDSTLFEPLPYHRPGELIRVNGERAGRLVAARMSWDDVAAWRAESDLFAGVEVAGGGRERRWREREEPVIVGAFTPGLPALLGITPIIGRAFTPAEVDERAPVVVIAEPLWARAFGRSADVLGATMTIDDRPLTIIGVMPAEFRFGPGGSGVLMAWIGMPERADPDIPLSNAVSPVFRLRNGVSLDVAQQRATALAARLQTSWTPRLLPFVEARRAWLGAGVETSMLMLLATAGLVLLVACVNVASLFLTRGAARRHELALRTALGASRARLARLLLAEGVAIAALGGLAAVVLSHWTIQTVVALIPPDMRTNLFVVSEPDIDGRVLVFAVAIAGLVALVSAAWPAVMGSRHGLRVSIGSGGQVAGTVDRRRAGRLLQAVQVGISVVLTSVAALFAASFVRMLTEDPGFNPDRLGTVSFALPEERYPTAESRLRAIGDALARVRQVPGVRSAAVGSSPAGTMMGDMVLPGDTAPAAVLAVRTVGVGYFEAAGIRLVAGRDFSSSDQGDTPRVAIIDEAGARRVFGTESPLGRRFRDHPARREATIIGVVETVAAFDFVQRQDRIGMYFVDAQDYPLSHFIVRADDDLVSTLARVRTVLEAHEPGLRVMSTGAAADRYDDAETFTRPRFYVVLVSMFALLALVTTAVGLYGLLAHAVGQRRREIGVRVTLGATPAQVRRLVLREALTPVLTGLAMGGLASWWLTGLIASLLYGIGPRDPRALALAVAALILTSAVAAIVPIRSATGVDPVHALRLE